MTYTQRAGRVRVPEGSKVAVGLGIDFDAMAIWDGSLHRLSQTYLHRGEFGGEVAVQRLLRLLDRHQIKATWCIPGNSIETFPAAVRDVAAAGHEIAHHGYQHENPTIVNRETERTVLQRGLDAFDRVLGTRPRGYRSPYWDISPNTLGLLEELGFTWDSSLMGNDLHPYYPRPITRPSTVAHGDHEIGDAPFEFGTPSSILEIPVSWYLDDFPAEEYIIGAQEGMAAVTHIEDRWRSIFDYAANEEEGCCYALTTHPQTIGRPHMIQMLDRLIGHMKGNGGAFMTLSDIAAATEI